MSIYVVAITGENIAIKKRETILALKRVNKSVVFCALAEGGPLKLTKDCDEAILWCS